MELVAWARDLAEQHLAESVPRRWNHSLGVEGQATRVAEACQPDGDLLIATAVLHDIGYAPQLVDTGLHSLDGARYLRSIDVDERLCGLVAHHSAAHTDAVVQGLADEMAEFEDERSPVRDALWWADMTVGPDGTRVEFQERMAEVRTRYGNDHPVTRGVDLSMVERTAAVERTEARLEALERDHV